MNTDLPYNVMFSAILSPSHDIKLVQVKSENKDVPMTWDDMSYLAIELGFDVIPRELC
jgi:hypothetical protein